MTTIRVRGVERLQQTLDDAAHDLEQMPEAFAATGRTISAAGRDLAPVRAGALAASVASTSTGHSATVVSALPYAGVIHYGWPARRITPRPFASQAAVETEPTWTRHFEAAVDDALDQIEGA